MMNDVVGHQQLILDMWSWRWSLIQTVTRRWSVMNVIQCFQNIRSHLLAPSTSCWCSAFVRVPPSCKPSPNSLLWLKRGLCWLQIPLLAPIGGSVPIKIWDIAGLSLWCLRCGDFLAKRCRHFEGAASVPRGLTPHLASLYESMGALLWRESSKPTFWHAGAGKSQG